MKTIITILLCASTAFANNFISKPKAEKPADEIARDEADKKAIDDASAAIEANPKAQQLVHSSTFCALQWDRKELVKNLHKQSGYDRESGVVQLGSRSDARDRLVEMDDHIKAQREWFAENKQKPLSCTSEKIQIMFDCMGDDLPGCDDPVVTSLVNKANSMMDGL